MYVDNAEMAQSLGNETLNDATSTTGAKLA